eukprot:scaffold71189_cov31-Tisochrysis_lutea.AAC.2
MADLVRRSIHAGLLQWRTGPGASARTAPAEPLSTVSGLHTRAWNAGPMVAVLTVAYSTPISNCLASFVV